MIAKEIAIIAGSSIGFIRMLIMYIASAISTYSDEYGSSISYGEKRYLIWMMIFFFVLAYGIYSLIAKIHKKTKNTLYSASLFALDGAIGFFFFFGQSIKSMISGESFYQDLLLSLIFLVSLSYGVFVIAKEAKAIQSSNR